MNDQDKSQSQLISELQALRAEKSTDKHSHDYLSSILEVLPDLAFIIDEEGTVLEAVASKINENLFYGEKDNSVGNTIWEIFAEKDSQPIMDTVRATILSGEQQRLVYFLKVPEGERWFEGRCTRLKAPIKGKKAVMWLARDITEERQSNKIVFEKNSLLSSVIEEMKDLFFVKDLQGRYQIMNQACLDFLGSSRDKVMGHDDFAIFPDEMAQKFREADQRTIEDGITSTFDELVRTPTGDITVMTTKGVYRNENNEVIGIFGLVKDISERIEKEEKLKIAREHAEAANEAKSVFLSRMSHELRTPLHAIIGFSQIQKTMYPDAPDHIKQCSEEIFNSGHHLLNLVNDILDIVRIEQKRMVIKLEHCELNSIMEQCINLVKQLADEHQVALYTEASSLSVKADNTRLKQVLINLLANAIKYNRHGGSVTLSTRTLESNKVEISVIDTGIGISAKDQQAIFEPLTRLKYAEEHQIDGSGIGLSLSKLLVEEMDGNILLESVVDRGTIFYVTLPGGEVIKKPYDQTPHASLLSNSNLSVLYIEDNESSTTLLKMMFSTFPNLILSTVSTAEEGIRVAQESTFNLIIIDINLPGMNGISALKALKEIKHLQDTKMVALSADVLPEQIGEAMAAGFDHYLTKPMDMLQLIEFINTI